MLVASGPFAAGPKPLGRRVVSVAARIADSPHIGGLEQRSWPSRHAGACRSGNLLPGHRSSRPAANREAATGLVGNHVASGVGSRQASGSAPGEPLLRPGGSKDLVSLLPADLRDTVPEQRLPRVMCGPVDFRVRRQRATRCICGSPSRSEDLRGVFSDTARGHRCRLDRLKIFLFPSGVYS